ncbi:MAG: phosphatase PAP2 family protein [Geobacteraceae bacterium]|nr:phosphatase PAP2 family protein [Geobacteraceae bacterium]
MQKVSNRTVLASSFFLAALAIVSCIRFVDTGVALGIWAFTSSQPVLKSHFENIPDTLSKIVAIGTVLMWLAYYLVVHTKGSHKPAHFFQLAATAVPVAFLLKTFMQFAFGRTTTRLWLKIGGPLEFNWFKPLQDSGGFPSGHMVVFTAFFTATWLYYPRSRPLVVAALSGLALALLLTSYHFVSDILAGICCGILTTLGIHHLFSKNRLPDP